MYARVIISSKYAQVSSYAHVHTENRLGVERRDAVLSAGKLPEEFFDIACTGYLKDSTM